MPKAEITSYSVVDLLSWQESGALQISPKFQRRSVWTTPAKGHFIDSILLEYPIPPIHIRLARDRVGRTVREVIDGQQRVRSVFDFIAGTYRIPLSFLKERLLSSSARSKSGLLAAVSGRDWRPALGLGRSTTRVVKAGRRPPAGEALTARELLVGEA